MRLTDGAHKAQTSQRMRDKTEDNASARCIAHAMPARPKKRWRSSVVFNRIIEACARTAELHPIIWKTAWEAMHWLPFLLPHDKSYNALRHFIAIKPGGLFLDVGANDGISV